MQETNMKKTLMISGAILVILIAGVLIFLSFMGMFSQMTVAEKTMGPYTVAYKTFIGPYSETGKVFDHVYDTLKEQGIDTTIGIGIYHDDPSKVPGDQLHSDCGVVLPDQGSVEKLIGILSVKPIQAKKSIVTSFPIKNSMSYMMGPMKAYPALMAYAKEKNLKITLTYELYDMPSKTIHFVANVE